MEKKCPYGVDCIPDDACKNCRGMVKCPRCGKNSLIPKSRNICYTCWRKTFS